MGETVPLSGKAFVRHYRQTLDLLEMPHNRKLSLIIDFTEQ